MDNSLTPNPPDMRHGLSEKHQAYLSKQNTPSRLKKIDAVTPNPPVMKFGLSKKHSKVLSRGIK